MSEVSLRRFVRGLIQERLSQKRRKSRLVDTLFEQEEKEDEEATTEFTGEYKGDPVDKTTNVKDVDPVEIANQLLSGDDDSPIVTSAKGQWFEYTGAAAKAWIENLGPQVFVDRLKALALKVPETGLAKKDMPFLPLPNDKKSVAKNPEDVKDALSPGGKYNVDFMGESAMKRGLHYLVEKTDPPAPNTFVGMDDPASQEFMTGGLEPNDGEENDDKIEVQLGGSIPASKAIPTQSNILIYKSMGFAVDGMQGGDLGAYASIDNEILDGHHRWAATMLNAPGADVGTTAKIDLKPLGTKKTLQYLTAIGNALGNATKTEGTSGLSDNMVMERWQRLAGLLKG